LPGELPGKGSGLSEWAPRAPVDYTERKRRDWSGIRRARGTGSRVWSPSAAALGNPECGQRIFS